MFLNKGHNLNNGRVDKNLRQDKNAPSKGDDFLITWVETNDQHSNFETLRCFIFSTKPTGEEIDLIMKATRGIFIRQITDSRALPNARARG